MGQRLQADAVAEEAQPDPRVGADEPAAVGFLGHFAVPVEHAPAQRLFAVADAHRRHDVFDDVLVALFDAVNDEARRRAHALRAAVADAAGIFDDVFGEGAGAVPDCGQIASFLEFGRVERRVGLGVGDEIDVHVRVYFDQDGRWRRDRQRGFLIRYQCNRKSRLWSGYSEVRTNPVWEEFVIVCLPLNRKSARKKCRQFTQTADPSLTMSHDSSS